jgi:very-short-patch-repair endonuclease
MDVNYYGYDRPHVSTIPQHTIGEYTVDFLVEYAQELLPKRANPNPQPRGARAQLIIECDGHDYHDRTKEQASRDRARDRHLQKRGFEVFRYTGSDIYNDPFKCALDAVDSLVRRVHAMKKQFEQQYPVRRDELLD